MPLATIVSAFALLLANPPDGLVGTPTPAAAHPRGSPIQLATVEVDASIDQRVRATLRWQPGVPADTSGGQVTGGQPRGFRLGLTPLDEAGNPIESAAIEVAVESPLISYRTVGQLVRTGALCIDESAHTILVVVAESMHTSLSGVASEFRFGRDEQTGSLWIKDRTDQLGEYQSITVNTGIPEGSRPLIASVDRMENEVTVGIAPWNPATERPTNPTPTVRARFSADFKQMIAVEAIQTEPPPADPPPSEPE